MCIRYPGFFALRALKSFDRIVFLEIALYSMCTILDIVKLKKLQKKERTGLQSNRIFPFTNAIFIFVKMGITTTTHDRIFVTLCYEIPDLGRIPSFESSASLDFCSSSFFLSRKSAQKLAIAFAWIRMRSSLVKVSLPDFSRASLKWLPSPSPIIMIIISTGIVIWIFVICIVE